VTTVVSVGGVVSGGAVTVASGGAAGVVAVVVPCPPPARLLPRLAGAKASPAEIGSEERPIWRLARPLAATATAAAMTMPSSARPIQLRVALDLIVPAPL
jgi:hypothetical protein